MNRKIYIKYFESINIYFGKIRKYLLFFYVFLFFSFEIMSQTPSSGCGGSGDDSGTHGGGGSDTIPSQGGIPITIPIVRAVDPNDIQGPVGVTSKKWMAAKDNFGFTVRFENDPDFANGPAQTVRITIPIDPNFDINSLRIGNFGFGNLLFNVPPNSPTYTTRLDVRDSLGVYVDVLAGIDIINHRAIWIFETIDPATGTVPQDPYMGFLPLRDTSINQFNDSIPNKGEGFVTYTINPKTNAHTGDTTNAQASIYFDVNAPVLTNIEKNTIDAGAPISHITYSLTLHNDSITLNFNGNDDPGGCGIKSYNLYVAQDSSNYITYLTNITDNAVKFRGNNGSTYHFFSLAVDSVGNREPLKSLPDVSVKFTRDAIVSVKAFIEGFYLGGGVLIASINQAAYPDISDTLILQLARSNPPYNILYSDTSLLQTNGTVVFRFDTAAIGSSYYLILRHRSAIETWSSTPLAIQLENNSYDFTNSVTKAYGNNLVDLGDGNFAIWSGDISWALVGVGIQDGVVESQDYSDMENAVVITLLGYTSEDITGDGVVETLDYSIMENNVFYTIHTIHP